MAAYFRDNTSDKYLCLLDKEKNIQEHFKLVGQNAYRGSQGVKKPWKKVWCELQKSSIVCVIFGTFS